MSYCNNTEKESECDYSDMPDLIPCSPESYVLEVKVARTNCFAYISGIVNMADRLIQMEENEEEALNHLTKFRRIINIMNVFLRLPSLTIKEWNFTSQIFSNMQYKSLWDSDSLIDYHLHDLRNYLLSDTYSNLDDIDMAFCEPLAKNSLRPLMAKLLELS
jgi:hypothetical protein